MIFDDDEVLEYLEHFGVKGMRWGQRRAQSRSERRLRFKSGTPTLKDKAIRELDLDRSRSERKEDRKSINKKEVAVQLAVAGAGFILAKKVLMANTPMAALVGTGAGLTARGFHELRSDKVPNREKRLTN
jgi:hypothetical protein